MSISYSKTPIVELEGSIFEQGNARLFVKREDLNHPRISGNKWWKLKYNLEEAYRSGYRRLLTFGGAFSNHLFATAAAAQETNFQCIGVVRGEKVEPLNSTLQFASDCGMRLHWVSRNAYRRKGEQEFLDDLRNEFGDFYLIPEGGTNPPAVRGCAEFAHQLLTEMDFDYLCLPVGTGGTIAGLISGLEGEKKVIGVPVLKGAEFLEGEIKQYTTQTNWQLVHDFHFGGYGKSSPELTTFIKKMKVDFNLPLDFVYTGKMMFGVFELIRRGFFPKGAKVLAIHTGGLQDVNPE